MQYFLKLVKLLLVSLIFFVIGLQSCAYYNTFYNAEQYYGEAQKLTRENQSETVSREEINLYSKAIEKSKKLLQGYPDSKYRDDAQYLIAKSYYFKGDYLLAKRYFDDLALNYGISPYTKEVPLWIGRCLLKVGDLEMARHEASRMIKEKVDRTLQAEALLLMGEIAVQQDSLALAEHYLEQVIDRSPSGFTKAQAQYQVGRMRENQNDYEGALKAYKAVARYKPSESLKVEAIIRQTSMLKALNRDTDAIEMIREMLLSDKFVDIRGQLEVELGKLLLVMDEIDQAESKLISIVEDYSRQEVAAEADFILGELYLTKKLDYKAAKSAYQDIKSQSIRSPLVSKGGQRIKQIERYEKIQLDYTNFNRQLAGFPPLVKKKATTKGRASRSGRSRGRSTDVQPGNPAAEQAKSNKFDSVKSLVTVAVSAEDSLRLFSSIDENRYSLAEYMLFEFTRVDTSLEILRDLETSSSDSAIKHQSAYMQYYALESVRGDEEAAKQVMEHIQIDYPDYYMTITDKPEDKNKQSDPDEERFRNILPLFDKGLYKEASAQFLDMKNDPKLSSVLRSKACFNYAWLNDHFLYNKSAAIEAYSYMIDHFQDEPLAATARIRLDALKQEPAAQKLTEESIHTVDDSAKQDQNSIAEPGTPKAPKQGEKNK